MGQPQQPDRPRPEPASIHDRWAYEEQHPGSIVTTNQVEQPAVGPPLEEPAAPPTK